MASEPSNAGGLLSFQVPDVTIPDSLVIGDYWQWRVPAEADYPASTWTLTFAFAGPDTVNVASGWTIAASTGGTWLVQVAKATTAIYTPGRYQYRGYVTNGTERYQIFDGWIVFQPNVAVATGDQRSTNQKILAAIENAITGRLTTQEESYSVGGRSISKTAIPELLRLRGIYTGIVWREMNPGQGMPSTGVSFPGVTS